MDSRQVSLPLTSEGGKTARKFCSPRSTCSGRRPRNSSLFSAARSGSLHCRLYRAKGRSRSPGGHCRAGAPRGTTSSSSIPPDGCTSNEELMLEVAAVREVATPHRDPARGRCDDRSGRG